MCTFESNQRSSNRRAPRPPPIPEDLGEVTYPPNVNSNMCGWQQSTEGQDMFDWIRHSGTTSSQNTGPRGDKTTGQGKQTFFTAFNQMFQL